MKKLFYILILFSFLSKAQTPMFKIGNYTVTDFDLHYAVNVNMSSFFASNAYYITKRPLLSGLIGSLLSFAVSEAKEQFIDKHPSGSDREGNCKGATVGGLMTFGITDTMQKRQAKLDTLKYQFRTL